MKKMGKNMEMLADRLSDRPMTIQEISAYMKVGTQYALDTIERLCERGIARRYGSNKFIKVCDALVEIEEKITSHKLYLKKATLDFCKDPRTMDSPCCIRCGKKIGDGSLSILAHYNYDTFEIRKGHVSKEEVSKPWFNNVILGQSCAKKIKLI